MVESTLIRMAETLTDGFAGSMPSFLSRPTKVLFIPDEPTTLALAVIGAATLAVYAVASRYLRPGSDSEDITRRVSKPSEREPAERQIHPRRGAA